MAPRGSAPALAKERGRSASTPPLVSNRGVQVSHRSSSYHPHFGGLPQRRGSQTAPRGEGVKHLVPWFMNSKPEKGMTKHRLISDCRELNNFFKPHKFRLDNVQQIFPYLQKGWWGAKLDLKDAYFHLPLCSEVRKYMVLKVGKTFGSFKQAVLA